jgi:2-polyprenyl-3-methyl-5-hydroxy-6-metoxy-1,4-benzoquinol methylase
MLSKLAMGTGDFECTVCRERENLTPFEKRAGSDGAIYDLWLCLNCHVILNATHLRTAQAGNAQDAIQAETSDEFYAVDADYLANVPAAVDANGFTDFLIAQCPDLKLGTALDFGAGQGITSAAAAKVFDRVYAAELAQDTLRAVHAMMPLRDKVHITDDFAAIPDKLDAVYAMHTFEHLPKLRDFLDQFVTQLAPGGAIFFQVPMLRREYLVCVHYTFFTEAACRAMARELGMELTGVWYDGDVDFLTCIMRKPMEAIIEVACGCGETGLYTIDEAARGCKSCEGAVVTSALAQALRTAAVSGAVNPTAH